MSSERSLAGHLVDVATILALGLLYMVLLSFGTALGAGRRTLGSVWRAGGSVARRTRQSTH